MHPDSDPSYAKNHEDKSMDEKKPRLFYWEPAIDAWCPMPDYINPASIGVITEGLEDGEKTSVEFKRIDMTDEELNQLPEA